MTLDHIKPLAKGGANTIDNVQALCGACNVAKGEAVADYRRGVTWQRGRYDLAGLLVEVGEALEEIPRE